MLDPNIFRGELVRLTSEDPETAGKAFSGWTRDAEYTRLLDNDPARIWSAKRVQSGIEKDLEKDAPDFFFFVIRTLVEERLIGFLALFELSWAHGDTWVGIGLGERDFWGKGYGTDAMRVALRYTFTELNLRRVTLGVFAYNPRALKSYEKAGFKVEGRLRRYIAREGQRHDMIIMGVLREEWLQSV
jgi:RimJ/RimL family protein N-acetyltransferase